MNASTLVFAGGISLIGGALAFVGVFVYLAAKFSYPRILDGGAEQVLPRLRAGGARMRATWAIYSLLPLLLVIGAFGTYAALRSSREAMLLALVLASIGSLSMSLGLMRWIIGAFRNVTPRVRRIAGLNNYLLPAWMIVLGGAILRYRLS
jgi:hypothetical protein